MLPQTPLTKRLSRSNVNTKFKSPVVRKPITPQSLPKEKPLKRTNSTRDSRTDAVELLQLIQKWKRVCQEILIDLQTEGTLEELARELRFELETVGDYDSVNDCFVN